MKSQEYLTGVRATLHQYQFLNPWMALNQENHKHYVQMTPAEQQQKLQKVLINNIISFFKAVGHQETETMMVSVQVQPPKFAGFKDQKLLTFMGGFVSNVRLPDYIGLGKSVSRGYGTIRKIS